MPACPFRPRIFLMRIRSRRNVPGPWTLGVVLSLLSWFLDGSPFYFTNGYSLVLGS